MTNTRIWDSLCRVPPEHLKGFKKGGGFSGTAIKPMWTFHRMTEEFGPCGTGWGINRPEFQTLPVKDELMVYCTVSVWYGKPEQLLWGVGGDKVAAAQQSGLRTDDEAFKKAFTDAVTNALKHLGAGADVHMGLWDGNKYIDEDEEKPAKAPPAPSKAENREPFTRIQTGLREIERTGSLEDLKRYWTGQSPALKAMPDDWYATLCEQKDAVKAALSKKVDAFGLEPINA